MPDNVSRCVSSVRSIDEPNTARIGGTKELRHLSSHERNRAPKGRAVSFMAGRDSRRRFERSGVKRDAVYVDARESGDASSPDALLVLVAAHLVFQGRHPYVAYPFRFSRPGAEGFSKSGAHTSIEKLMARPQKPRPNKRTCFVFLIPSSRYHVLPVCRTYGFGQGEGWGKQWPVAV